MYGTAWWRDNMWVGDKKSRVQKIRQSKCWSIGECFKLNGWIKLLLSSRYV